MEKDKIREAIAIRPLVLDLREYANNLPDEIVNNYHEDLDSLIMASSKEMQSAQEEIERLRAELSEAVELFGKIHGNIDERFMNNGNALVGTFLSEHKDKSPSSKKQYMVYNSIKELYTCLRIKNIQAGDPQSIMQMFTQLL